MFVTICMKLDIVQAMSGAVSRFAENMREYWNMVKMILRYMKRTSNVTLCYEGSKFILC